MVLESGGAGKYGNAASSFEFPAPRLAPNRAARTWGTGPAYWMVTWIETLLASDPLVLVAVPVTVTTPLNGVGPEPPPLLPPPPQETAPNITQSNSTPNRVLRKVRRLSALLGMRPDRMVNTIPRAKTKV